MKFFSERIVGMECPESKIVYPQKVFTGYRMYRSPIKLRCDYEVIQDKISKEKLKLRYLDTSRYFEWVQIEKRLRKNSRGSDEKCQIED